MNVNRPPAASTPLVEIAIPQQSNGAVQKKPLYRLGDQLLNFTLAIVGWRAARDLPKVVHGALWLAFFCIAGGRGAVFAEDRPPNFVVIFTDDQGYGDLSCFGGKHVSTPRIDQMAAEGARLTNFYVAASLCTPSRAALMTGCYPIRVDMAVGSNYSVLLASDSKGLNPEEITIAEVLKTRGYHTGIFGKWHLGDQPEFLPTRQGFDEFFGIPYSHDIHPFHPKNRVWEFPSLPLLENETVVEMDPDADDLTRRITERSLAFIDKNKGNPFFLYVAHPMPHRPLHVSPRFMEGVEEQIAERLLTEEGAVNYELRNELYSRAISEIDWSVGEILDKLREAGIDEKTLVIFTSDNGPSVGSAGPLRGGKGSTLEGGLREPTVVRWPGRIPAGEVNNELLTAMDMLPTFAALAGAKVPDDRVIDGKNVMPVLRGEEESPHESFFYYKRSTLEAVRSGPWKLHIKGVQPAFLYNLDNDRQESVDVKEAHPGLVADLMSRIEAFQEEIALHSRPASFVADPRPLTKKPESQE